MTWRRHSGEVESYIRRLLLLVLICIQMTTEPVNADTALMCYTCNSHYQKCGDGVDFDSRIQKATYCYGRCVKMNIYPGDFIIRACSSFVDNSLHLANSTLSTQPLASQQCYISTYIDPGSSVSLPAFVCVCDDQHGCNRATTHRSYLAAIFCLILMLVHSRAFTHVT